VHAKRPFRTDDVYVRQADLILVGDTISVQSRNGVPVAVVTPTSVVFGRITKSPIDVRNYPHTPADLPVLSVGHRSLLFLAPTAERDGTYACLEMCEYPMVTDRECAARLARVLRLVAVRQAASQRDRAAALVGLLDSPDTDLAAAASNYLDFLVNGDEDGDDALIPPSAFSRLTQKREADREVTARCDAWRRWWQKRIDSSE
jgi:hypothetical protein